MSGNADRPVIVYGNCQAQVVADALRADPAMAGVRVLIERAIVGQVVSLPTTDTDVRSCRIYVRQAQDVGFAREHLLPADCARVRFPALGSLVLWPLHRYNPFLGTVLPGAATFWYGDRVIAEGVARDVPPDDLLAYYLTAGEAYLPDMVRVAELDDERMRRMDAACDVPMGDAIGRRLRTEPLFSSRTHPSNELMRLLVERVAAAAAVHEPAFGRVDAGGTLRARPEIFETIDRCEVPIHPGVAAALGLEWYDEKRCFRQPDGRSYSYEGYFRALIAYWYAHREARERRERGLVAEGHPFVGERPIRGATIQDGLAPGWYPDGFFGQKVEMNVMAARAASRLRISGYCSKHHAGEVRLTCAVGSGAPVEVEIRPNATFEADYAVTFSPGEFARVTIASSSTFNMRALGEGPDSRDLSVLVSEIRIA